VPAVVVFVLGDESKVLDAAFLVFAALVLEAIDAALDSTVDWLVASMVIAAADTLESTAPRVVALVPAARGVVALILGTTGGVLDVNVPEVVALVPGRLEDAD